LWEEKVLNSGHKLGKFVKILVGISAVSFHVLILLIWQQQDMNSIPPAGWCWSPILQPQPGTSRSNRYTRPWTWGQCVVWCACLPPSL